MSPAFKKFEERALTLLKDEEQDHYGLGALWNELVHGRYAEKELGQSPGAWWQAHLGGYCEVRTIKRRGRVAKRYSKEVMIAEGDIRLDLLLAYLRKRHVKPTKDPRPVPIAFKDPDGNAFNKPFSECTEQEMEWAVRPPEKHAKPRPPPGGSPAPWETDFLWFGRKALDAIGAGGWGDVEAGATFEVVGTKVLFSMRKIPFLKVREAAVLLQQAWDDYMKSDRNKPPRSG
jgi:hypothetical protein